MQPGRQRPALESEAGNIEAQGRFADHSRQAVRLGQVDHQSQFGKSRERIAARDSAPHQRPRSRGITGIDDDAVKPEFLHETNEFRRNRVGSPRQNEKRLWLLFFARGPAFQALERSRTP